MESGVVSREGIGVLAGGATPTERQLVVFALGSEEYGVGIGTVREIIRMQSITKVPRSPQGVEGVINLRGKVTPVIDMRKRFGIPVEEETKDIRIVVIDAGGHDLGVIVDAVIEVLRIPADCIEPPSDIISSMDSQYLTGIAKVSSRLILLLDLEKVLSRSELSHLARMSRSDEAADESSHR